MSQISGLRYSSPVRFTLRQRLVLSIVPPVISIVAKMLAVTWKTTVHNADRFELLLREPGHCVFAFWHEALAVAAYRFRNTGYHTLTSYSFDGELAARVIGRFGLAALRGSSSRGGSDALHDMAVALRDVAVVGVTVDGPKGPRHDAKPGAAILAARAQVPIIPFVVQADRAWRLNSWDRFLIPKPFARVAITFGAPIPPPPSDAEADVEPVRAAMESALRQLSRD